MMTIRIKATGKVTQVDRDTAHGMIERDEAELVNVTEQKPPVTYATRQMTPTQPLQPIPPKPKY